MRTPSAHYYRGNRSASGTTFAAGDCYDRGDRCSRKRNPAPGVRYYRGDRGGRTTFSPGNHYYRGSLHSSLEIGTLIPHWGKEKAC